MILTHTPPHAHGGSETELQPDGVWVNPYKAKDSIYLESVYSLRPPTSHYRYESTFVFYLVNTLQETLHQPMFPLHTPGNACFASFAFN